MFTLLVCTVFCKVVFKLDCNKFNSSHDSASRNFDIHIGTAVGLFKINIDHEEKILELIVEHFSPDPLYF